MTTYEITFYREADESYSEVYVNAPDIDAAIVRAFDLGYMSGWYRDTVLSVTTFHAQTIGLDGQCHKGAAAYQMFEHSLGVGTEWMQLAPSVKRYWAAQMRRYVHEQWMATSGAAWDADPEWAG